jgi:hypothetical protein
MLQQEKKMPEMTLKQSKRRYSERDVLEPEDIGCITVWMYYHNNNHSL